VSKLSSSYIVALFSLLGILMYHFNQAEQTPVGADVVNIILTKAECPFIEQICIINLPDGKELGVAFSPKGLPALEPIELRISSSSIALDQMADIEIWFEGRDMNMGQHYFNLSYVNNQIVGKGMIPVCTVDVSMVWKINIAFNYRGENNLLILN